MNDLMTQCEALTYAMVTDFESKGYVHVKRIYSLSEGRNYIKIIMADEHTPDRQSVAGFIVKKSPKKAIDNKTGQPFNVGDMLMAASWNAPATNFARGNVFDLDPRNVRWTGV